MIVGTAGMLTTERFTDVNFHLMNTAWNVVNVGIALPAYFGARKRLKKNTMYQGPLNYSGSKKPFMESIWLQMSYTLVQVFLCKSLLIV